MNHTFNTLVSLPIISSHTFYLRFVCLARASLLSALYIFKNASYHKTWNVIFKSLFAIPLSAHSIVTNRTKKTLFKCRKWSLFKHFHHLNWYSTMSITCILHIFNPKSIIKNDTPKRVARCTQLPIAPFVHIHLY